MDAIFDELIRFLYHFFSPHLQITESTAQFLVRDGGFNLSRRESPPEAIANMLTYWLDGMKGGGDQGCGEATTVAAAAAAASASAAASALQHHQQDLQQQQDQHDQGSQMAKVCNWLHPGR